MKHTQREIRELAAYVCTVFLLRAIVLVPCVFSIQQLNSETSRLLQANVSIPKRMGRPCSEGLVGSNLRS